MLRSLCLFNQVFHPLWLRLQVFKIMNTCSLSQPRCGSRPLGKESVMKLSQPRVYRVTRSPLTFFGLDLFSWCSWFFSPKENASLVRIYPLDLSLPTHAAVDEMIKVAELNGFRRCPSWLATEVPSIKLTGSGAVFVPSPKRTTCFQVDRNGKARPDPKNCPFWRRSILMQPPAKNENRSQIDWSHSKQSS